MMDRFFPVTWSKRTSFTTFDSRLPAKKDILDSSMEAPKKDVKRHQTPTKPNSEQLCNPNSDMEFVQNFTPPDFRAKNFTPSISHNSTVLVRKNTKNE